MSEYAKPIDVTTSADLARIAEHVNATRTAVPLTRDDEVIAVVKPAPKRRARKGPSEADIAAFQASAGGWKDHIDVDKFLEENYRQRSVSTRSPAKL